MVEIVEQVGGDAGETTQTGDQQPHLEIEDVEEIELPGAVIAVPSPQELQLRQQESNTKLTDAQKRRNSFLKLPSSRLLSPFEEVDEIDVDYGEELFELERSTSYPGDLNYSLRGDEEEDHKFYIYKVRDVNMVPKKECLGRVFIPQRNLKKNPLTLEELRRLIRQSSDEMLQDAAKQRFRYLCETYHLVASDESFTPVDQLYPSKGVFIKLDTDHPFSQKRVNDSYTAKLQQEYEKKFGPIQPRQPRKGSIAGSASPTNKPRPKKPWEIVAEEQERRNKKSIFTDPVPFKSDEIVPFDSSSRTTTRGRGLARQPVSSIYSSIEHVDDGKYRDRTTFGRSVSPAVRGGVISRRGGRKW